MIILDTNVVSELMKPLPAQSLLTWLDQQESDTLYITSVTIGEIMYGLHALPSGKRRTSLEVAFKQVLSEAFMDRSFPFDDAAAMMYGKIMGSCKEKGRVMSVCDGQIASIASHRHARLATRNVKDFEACKITLVNPFE
jgi:predicted nucleic acid-binding protein